MARQLKATVYIADEDGVVRGFGPGDIVPDWVAERIANPDVWDDGDEMQPEAKAAGDIVDEPPPKTGKGSGIAAWRAHAESLGITVPDDASREEIIDAVDAR